MEEITIINQRALKKYIQDMFLEWNEEKILQKDILEAKVYESQYEGEAVISYKNRNSAEIYGTILSSEIHTDLYTLQELGIINE